MSARLTITRGLPGSGKTTWAREQQGADTRTWLVGRDHIRRMGPVPWPLGDAEAERLVTVVQAAVIRALLAEGCHVIADDTSLPLRSAHQLAAVAASVGLGVPMSIHDLTSVPVGSCVERDAARPEGERVGEDTIRAMSARWLTPGC